MSGKSLRFRPATLVPLLVASSVGTRCPAFPAAGEPPAPPDPVLNALRVEQVTSGIPGRSPGEPAREERQQITVDNEGRLLVLKSFSEPPKHYILRTDQDPPLVYEVSADGSHYSVRKGDLTERQKNRRYHELEILEFVKKLPAKERETILEENHLRPDGSREVTVKWGAREEVLGHQCRRLIVTENGLEIINVLVATEIAGGRSYFDLYQKLGTFSDDVLEKLRDIRGLPLKGDITVVTEFPQYRLTVEVKKIEEVQVPAGLFRPPAGAQEVVERAKEYPCPVCGKPVLPDEAGGQFRTGGKRLYFCTQDHYEEWLEDQ